MDILELVLAEIKRDNPFAFILKGGTALSVHHLERHRESEDLDFDIPLEFKAQSNKIVDYLKAILGGLVSKGFIESYKIGKEGFSSTDRYHMNIIVMTHRPYQTKFDLSFTEISGELEKEGELYFYTTRRMFVSKLLTFSSRENLKDFFDIHYLLKKVRPMDFSEPSKLADLIDRVIARCDEHALTKVFKETLRNLDLRFKNLKEKNLDDFVERTLRGLKSFRNELRRNDRN